MKKPVKKPKAVKAIKAWAGVVDGKMDAIFKTRSDVRPLYVHVIPVIIRPARKGE